MQKMAEADGVIGSAQLLACAISPQLPSSSEDMRYDATLLLVGQIPTHVCGSRTFRTKVLLLHPFNMPATTRPVFKRKLDRL